MRSILLIAESDLELRDACRRFFAERGYDVETAADGLDCVEKLRRVSPAVLVLDRELRWGGADGVLALLREQGAQCEVSVVLTAPTDDSANVAVDIERPVVRFLPKPFGLTALLESVRGLMVRTGLENPFVWNRGFASPELFIG